MRRLVFSAFLLWVGIVIGVVFVAEFHSVPAGVAIDTQSTANAPAVIDTQQIFVSVSKAVTPAVVNIAATRLSKKGEGLPGLPFADPLFKRFFGDDFFKSPDPQGKRKSESLGSGVIIGSEGIIVTNYHVIEKADEIVVVLSDKREFVGKVAGTDPKSDLAVIRIDAKNLPTIPWGDSSKLEVGEYVLAIGSPFGFTQSVTMGIVSAIGRENVGLTDYENFIQTDAAINPGNSGGAMVNIRGELIGINTAIFTRSGGYMGIGFAVPSDMARSVVESLIKTGAVVRGWLGVAIQNVTAPLAKGFGLENAQGALVSEVMQGSPAEKAGLRRGDVIVQFGEKTIEETNQLRNLVADAPVGKKVTVRLIREKKPMALEVLIEAQPNDMFARRSGGGEGDRQERRSTRLSGIEVMELTEDLARQFELEPTASGVVVVAVEVGSLADEAGILKGDIIIEVNRQGVRDLAGYEDSLSKAPKNEPILLLIGRQNRTLFLTVNP